MLKDTRKTKAQLIEELDLERQKSARVDLSGAERQLAVERVRVAAMEMRSTGCCCMTRAARIFPFCR